MEIQKFDAIILGGGVIGLTMAVQGVRMGQKVILIDKNDIGYGASGAGSGILMTQGATQFHSLFREMYVRSVNEYYPQWIDFLNEALTISGPSSNCQALQIHQTGSLQLYSDENKFKKLQSQIEREASRGFETLHSSDSLRKSYDHLLNLELLNRGFNFPQESIIHNGTLIKHLRAFLVNHPHSKILERMPQSPEWVNEAKAWSLQGEADIQAQNMIITSGAWVDEVLRPMGFESRMTPVRGQLAWYQHHEIQLETSIHMDGHFYAIPREGGFILGATTEAREWVQEFGDTGTQFLKTNIQRYLASDFHQMTPIRAWAGLRPRTRDRKPLMGSVDPNKKIWMSAGHFKNGLSMAPLAAELMWDKILGNEPKLDFDEFSPLRQKGLVPL